MRADRRRLLPLFLALTLAFSVAPARPVRAQVDLDALDAYIANARADWRLPGLAIAIVKDGQVVMEKGYGVRDIEKGGRVDENTLFAIASNTKAFTAASLAILVDEGEVSWDDPVRKFLPWFELYAPYVSEDMRIRDLLSHRSGLGTFSGDLLWYGSTYSAEEVIRRARFLEPAYPFRSGYGYSNLMFVTAGLVIEAISGQSWPDFVSEHFFQPLGMDRTVTTTSVLPDTDDVATPHGRWRGTWVTFPWKNWDNMVAAGGIISSVSDMARWLRLQLGQGTVDGERFFTAARSSEMWTVQNPQAVSAGTQRQFPSVHFQGYGMGWSLQDYLGRKVVSHGGGYDGMYSRVILVPEEDLGVVILSNGMTSLQTAIGYRVLDAYLGGEEVDWSARMLPGEARGDQRKAQRIAAIENTRDPSAPASLALDAYAGTYTSDLYGDVTIAVEGDGLLLTMVPSPGQVAHLSPLHHDTFLLEWKERFPFFDKGSAHFVLDAAGRVAELELYVPNDDFWFEELKLIRRP